MPDNRPSISADAVLQNLNVIEHDLYQPNNMQMIFMATVDLCASPDFNSDELGIAREVTGKRRNRLFVYTSYVGILSRES